MDNFEAEAIEWLDNVDTEDREGRISRLSWVIGQMPDQEVVTFKGGIMTLYLFDEARVCYVYGLYLATITMGMAYIEQSIAAIFYAHGKQDIAKQSADILFTEALNEGLISQSDYENLKRIRSTRNPITHFKKPLSSNTLERKSVEQNQHPALLIEGDAKFVMESVFKLLGQFPLV